MFIFMFVSVLEWICSFVGKHVCLLLSSLVVWSLDKMVWILVCWFVRMFVCLSLFICSSRECQRKKSCRIIFADENFWTSEFRFGSAITQIMFLSSCHRVENLLDFCCGQTGFPVVKIQPIQKPRIPRAWRGKNRLLLAICGSRNSLFYHFIRILQQVFVLIKFNGKGLNDLVVSDLVK